MCYDNPSSSKENRPSTVQYQSYTSDKVTNKKSLWFFFSCFFYLHYMNYIMSTIIFHLSDFSYERKAKKNWNSIFCFLEFNNHGIDWWKDSKTMARIKLFSSFFNYFDFVLAFFHWFPCISNYIINIKCCSFDCGFYCWKSMVLWYLQFHTD